MACASSVKIIFIIATLLISCECYLKPQETASRQIKTLDGIWKFRLEHELGLQPTRDDHNLPPDVSLNI